MSGQPCFDSGDFSVRKKRHDRTALQIADERSIAMVSSERPVVDADHPRRLCASSRSSPYNPEQGIIADRLQKAPRQARRRPAAERQPEMAHDMIEPRRTARGSDDQLSDRSIEIAVRRHRTAVRAHIRLPSVYASSRLLLGQILDRWVDLQFKSLIYLALPRGLEPLFSP
jgi:hypothetical protein